MSTARSDLARLAERFWSYVVRQPNGCWEWQGAIVLGYGHFRCGSKNAKAHRAAWELVHGPIPKGRMVLHHCDNRRCVNVETHLYVGDARDNQRDVYARGRENPPRGERHGAHRLTEADVRFIRSDEGKQYTGRALAARFGVAPPAISNVRRERTWRHVAAGSA